MAGQSFSQEELDGERKHFKEVVNAFLFYRTHADKRLKEMRRSYDLLPSPHRLMLPNFLDDWKDICRGVDLNYQFVKTIIRSAMGMFENSSVSQFDSNSSILNLSPAREHHMDKVRTTIRQFYRDWSEEGKEERDTCYKPILDEIMALFPSNERDAKDISILVPGSGLGRLAFDIACRGYCCQGNEFSMFMLLGSNFILNQCQGVKVYSLCPWIHQHSNLISYKHRTNVIKVPDVNPADFPSLSDFSMSAGDFLQIYNTPDSWDCVASCFFLDTAPNVIRYLERIYHILKPGGYWINFGPLLYHFAEIPHEFSIELSWEEIKRIAVDHIGFKIMKELHNQPSCYIQNPNSMVEMSYKCVFVVAKKPLLNTSSSSSASPTPSNEYNDTTSPPPPSSSSPPLATGVTSLQIPPSASILTCEKSGCSGTASPSPMTTTSMDHGSGTDDGQCFSKSTKTDHM